MTNVNKMTEEAKNCLILISNGIDPDRLVKKAMRIIRKYVPLEKMDNWGKKND